MNRNKMKVILSAILIAFSLLSKADNANPNADSTWVVTPNNYQYSMTVTAVLIFDGVESTDMNDKVSAFVGNDCRGVAQPTTYIPSDDRYIANLTIYGNNPTGDTISFYIKDNSSNEIIEISKKIPFQSNSIYGTPSNPYKITTTYNLTFVIKADGELVNMAKVNLSGYGEKITDENGEVYFLNVMSADSIPFSVITDKYKDYNSYVSVIDQDVIDTVILFSRHNFTFIVSDNIGNKVKDAKIDLYNDYYNYETKITNSSGEAVFDSVIVDNYKYTIIADGYYPFNGTLNISTDDTLQNVTITLVQKLEATNFISPNGDNINDCWIIDNPELYKLFELTIYNTSGEIIYKTQDYQNDWCGTKDDIELPNGTYLYIFKNPEGNIVFKGAINLIR